LAPEQFFETEDLRQIAVRVAGEAAGLLRDEACTNISRLSRVIRGETTQVDLEVEDYIIDLLRRELGQVRIVTEEQGVVGEGPVTAVVDPLDGSKNYLNCIPWASVSIALLESGGTLRDVKAGAVAPIFYGDVISFGRGRGCFLGAARLEKPSNPSRFIYVYIEHPEAAHRLAEVIGGLGRGYKIRSLGSAALEIAYTGIGRGTLFLDLRSKLRNVDIAAAMGITLECGGEVLGANGEPLNIGTGQVEKAGTVIAVPNASLASRVAKILTGN